MLGKKLRIEKIVAEKGGKYLSKRMINGRTYIDLECDKGHIWTTRKDNIQKGTWCPECQKLTLEEMQQLAAAHGGKCLSLKYINNVTPLEWKCDKGHTWWATPANIKAGTWCPKCQKLTLEEMQRIAEDRGGKCLSSTYINAHTKLEWECEKGHTWFADPVMIKAGTWCPECQKLTIEEMQQIAVARGGECLSSTYINAYTKLEWKCKVGHTWWAKPDSIKYHKTWCPFCANEQKKFVIRKKYDIQMMQQLAAERGGWCLSQDYFTLQIPLEWKCDKGHTWWAAPSNIQRGTWCPECQKLTLEEMQQLAAARGGKCLSSEYINSSTKLEWECEKGHTWLATSNTIKAGKWCMECQKLTIEEMQQLAADRGGKCLSSEYVNVNTPLEWECEKGHIWWTKPDPIKYGGTWCPECRKLTLEEMQQLAIARGGKCLASEYINYNTKLEWKCKEGILGGLLLQI